MISLARRRGIMGKRTAVAGSNYFPSSVLTPGSNNADSPVTLGVIIRAKTAGKSITGMRYWATSAAVGNIASMKLYDGSGTLLGTVAGTKTLTAGWNDFILPSAVASVLATDYIPAVFLQTTANYSATALSPITSNPDFGITNAGDGRYAYGTTAQVLSAASSGTSSWYGMDLIYS